MAPYKGGYGKAVPKARILENEQKEGDQKQKEIESVATSAQLAWFSLLGFLAFYALILLTTDDADFFSTSKQTQLPIISIGISSQVFYFAAPVVATILYIYLHFLCLVLWSLAQATPARVLQKSLSTSLIGTVVLALKPQTQPRGLDKSQWVIARFLGIPAGLLIWLLHPAVLSFSVKASDASPSLIADPITRDIGDSLSRLFTVPNVTFVCFIISALIGLVSFWNALAIRRPEEGRLGVIALLKYAAVQVPALVALSLIAVAVGALMWLREPSIDIRRALLAQTPAGWVPAEARRETYRRDWCKEDASRTGIPPALCAVRPKIAEAKADLDDRRSAFCESAPQEKETCEALFADRDRTFATDYARMREGELEGVPELNLEGRDLTRMDATGARLTNARLQGAILTGADLPWSNLEGAVLIGADLNGATGRDVTFDHADLTDAWLQEAVLRSGSFAGAALLGARLDRANLTDSGLEDADLSPWRDEAAKANRPASLTSVDLSYARLQGAKLTFAVLTGANLKGANLTRTESLRVSRRLQHLRDWSHGDEEDDKALSGRAA